MRENPLPSNDIGEKEDLASRKSKTSVRMEEEEERRKPFLCRMYSRKEGRTIVAARFIM